jgi:hypothetical protein
MNTSPLCGGLDLKGRFYMAKANMKMTINDVIAKADELRINTLSDEQKYTWVYELECVVREMTGDKIPLKNFPEDIELKMPVEHEDVYVKHLAAKIDYYNGEMKLYANDIEVYNDAMKEARAWWIRQHRPASSGRWVV